MQCQDAVCCSLLSWMSTDSTTDLVWNETAPVSLMLTEAVFRICQCILLFLVNLGASSCKCIRTFYVCLFYQWPTYNLYHEPFLAFHDVSIQMLRCFIFWSFDTCIDVSMDGNPRCWIPLCEYSQSAAQLTVYPSLKSLIENVFSSQTKCSQKLYITLWVLTGTR